MDRNDFNTLMDDVIHRENLPGNSAQDPKKTVRIMVRGLFVLFASDACVRCVATLKTRRFRKRR